MVPYKVFIVGHEGTTGLRIHERLSDRKDIELLATADEDRKNVEAIKEVAKGQILYSSACLMWHLRKLWPLLVIFHVRLLILLQRLELQLVGHMGSQNLVKATKQILQLKNILQILAVMRAV